MCPGKNGNTRRKDTDLPVHGTAPVCRFGGNVHQMMSRPLRSRTCLLANESPHGVGARHERATSNRNVFMYAARWLRMQVRATLERLTRSSCPRSHVQHPKQLPSSYQAVYAATDATGLSRTRGSRRLVAAQPPPLIARVAEAMGTKPRTLAAFVFCAPGRRDGAAANVAVEDACNPVSALLILSRRRVG